jgi:hypothetical protein
MKGGSWEEKFAYFAVTMVLKRALKPQIRSLQTCFETKSPILPQRTRGGAWLAAKLKLSSKFQGLRQFEGDV